MPPWMQTLLDGMIARSVPALTAVYEVLDPREDGRVAGTGTVLEFAGRRYLISALHVFEDFQPASFGGYRSRQGAPPLPLPGLVHPFAFPRDVGIIELPPQMPEETEVVPLHASEFMGSFDGAQDWYFVMGFPGQRSRFSGFAGGILSEATPYLTVLGSTYHDWFDPDLHFAIEWPQTPQTAADGRAVQLPNPDGFSGALVWRANYIGREAGWSPGCARVVGLAHTWDQRHHSLVCTRVEQLRGAILGVARRSNAYERWLRRGGPENDDWTDWFEAVRALPDLT